MTANAYILTIPAPCSFVNANDRGHWSVNYRRMKAWKERAARAAKAARLPRIDSPVRIVATVHRDAADLNAVAELLDPRRTILASVPSGGVAPTEQAGEAKKRHLHSCFPSDCDHIADRCCIDCCEPGGWAEPAATPTTEAGEGK